MKLCIIIPAYNEEKRISKTLADYLSNTPNFDFEAIIALNGCIDNTKGIVEGFQKKNPYISYINLEKKGKGFAIIEGFKEALKRENEYIGFVDADNSTDARTFLEMLSKSETLNTDGVIASRYIKGKSTILPPLPFKRRVASRVFNFLVRKLFGLNYTDTQAGAKIFKRSALEKILPKLGEPGWAFDIELLVRAREENLNIQEIPILWYSNENSGLRLGKASWQMFWAIIGLKFRQIFCK